MWHVDGGTRAAGSGAAAVREYLEDRAKAGEIADTLAVAIPARSWRPVWAGIEHTERKVVKPWIEPVLVPRPPRADDIDPDEIPF